MAERVDRQTGVVKNLARQPVLNIDGRLRPGSKNPLSSLPNSPRLCRLFLFSAPPCIFSTLKPPIDNSILPISSCRPFQPEVVIVPVAIQHFFSIYQNMQRKYCVTTS